MKLGLEFYNRYALEVAKDLIGKVIVCNNGTDNIRARIVEVEAYTGKLDKASHTYGGRRTNRTEVMYGRAGRIYVYFIYGMYNMMNIVTGDEGIGEAVLIRAVEPLNNLDKISLNRFDKTYDKLSNYEKKNLTNGPGKLCKALNITKSENGLDLLNDCLYIEDDGFEDFEIVESKRVGIDYAEEAIDFLYRFYIKNNNFVSVK